MEGCVMAASYEVSVSNLYSLIGTPAAPVIADVCIDEDFNADPRLIPGSFRHHHDQIESMATEIKERHVVVVCQKGLKLSHGAAALLRIHGIRAEVLSGGKFAWRDAGLPMQSTEVVPARKYPEKTCWVTASRPDADTLGCLWLIRRFVDPEAQILFVPLFSVSDVAEKFSAVPVGIGKTVFSVRQGESEFRSMLSKLGLENESLRKVARIVGGTGPHQKDLTAHHDGFLSAAIGISHLCNDDLEMMDKAIVLFDSIYSWARNCGESG